MSIISEYGNNFHIQRLLELELIQKNKQSHYELTTKGKEFANRYDDINKSIERQAKVTVMVIGVKKVKGVKYILMQKRLKHPYFGYFGVTSGKVRFGELIYCSIQNKTT